MKNTKLKENKAAVIPFSDYHEIPMFADNYNQLNKKFKLSGRLRWEEVEGVALDYSYLGLFWVGRKPSKEQIAKLLKGKVRG
jgi:hypothetical protein